MSEREALAAALLEATHRLRHIKPAPDPVKGLRPSETHLLFFLNHAQQRHPEGIKASELSSMLGVTPSSITQQVNQLEHLGLSDRKSDKDDRRSVRITLTQKGLDALAEFEKNLLESTLGLVDHLGEADAETLIRLINRSVDYFYSHLSYPESCIHPRPGPGR